MATAPSVLSLLIVVEVKTGKGGVIVLVLSAEVVP